MSQRSSGPFDNKQNRTKIMSPRTSQLIRKILKRTITEGTGKRGQPISYSAGGKTGTSEKVDPSTKKYSKHLRLASFIGFSPALDPHIVIYVFIDEPTLKPYYGGRWAAPVFAEIAEKTLSYLNVKPDRSEENLPYLVRRPP